MRSPNFAASRKMFPSDVERYCGRMVCVIEPIPMGQIHGLNVLETRHALLPTRMDYDCVAMNAVPSTIDEGKGAGSFLMVVNDLEVNAPSISRGCSAPFCGGLHQRGTNCPALVSCRGSKPTLTAYLSSNWANFAEPFMSTEFGELFVGEETLRVSYILLC